MTDETASLMLEHFRHLRAGQSRIETVLGEVVTRVGRLEREVANMHGDFVSLSLRLDHVSTRLDRIAGALQGVPMKPPTL